MGAYSRNKGAGGERELARLLADELGTEITRNLVQAREGGADLIGVEGWAVECKRAARVTPGLLRAWWAQAEQQADRVASRPALAFRGDREPWRIAVRLWDLLAIGPAPGYEHEGVTPAVPYLAKAQAMPMRPDPGGGEGRWPGWTWTATLSVPGFCALVREAMNPPADPSTNGSFCTQPPSPARDGAVFRTFSVPVE